MVHRPAVVPDVLGPGDDGVVEVTGGAQEVVRQPVLVIHLHLRGHQVVHKLRECRHFLVSTTKI